MLQRRTCRRGAEARVTGAAGAPKGVRGLAASRRVPRRPQADAEAADVGQQVRCIRQNRQAARPKPFLSMNPQCEARGETVMQAGANHREQLARDGKSIGPHRSIAQVASPTATWRAAIGAVEL